jgi:predicted ATP-dependent endonuclease of OLD family
MYISKISIKNFKCIRGQLDVDFSVPDSSKGSGLNIFVGDNNTGKSTIFEAFDFVRNGTKKDINEIKNKQSDESECWVEVTFTGDIENVIEGYAQNNKKELLKKLIFTKSDNFYFTIKRTAEDLKKIWIWNEENATFDEPSGIDGVVKALFDLDFIWADTNPEDISKFGATNICGKLLTEICKPFQSSDLFDEFRQSHSKVFNDEEQGLKSQLKQLSNEVEQICKSQFGDIGLEFHFEELSIEKFYSNVKIKIDDGVKTNMEEKGGGLQRAVALSLLQVYANKIKNNPGNAINKPFYLFIDEPEICLHPLAQFKLIESLLNLTSNSQIFINTHSPYIVKKSLVGNKNNFQITKKDQNGKIVINKGESKRIFGNQSPTWGEINYFAYNLPTIEFHNELYGFICKKLQRCIYFWWVEVFN